MNADEAARAARRFVAQNGAPYSYSLVRAELGLIDPQVWSVVFAVRTAAGAELDGPAVVLVDDRTGEARALSR